jgi:hypothetical protein
LLGVWGCVFEARVQVEDAIDAADAQAEYVNQAFFYNRRSVLFLIFHRYLQQKISGAKAALPEVAELNKQVCESLQNKTVNPL